MKKPIGTLVIKEYRGCCFWIIEFPAKGSAVVQGGRKFKSKTNAIYNAEYWAKKLGITLIQSQ